ncbi:MAG TPA: hypothetical protein GXX64_06235, partial [Bacteroidales bacterium]|nr:hypothetical protein [Bacteroidales bacterium]
MIKFEEHDDNLFRMLEEPVPLTPDAEMPCLVRLIQDDSPMGKHNKDLHGFDPERLTPRICTEVIDVNDLSDPNRGSARCDGLMSIQYYRYELIGTHVKEGSDDWAWYQMMQGEKIIGTFHKPLRFYAIKKGCDYCALYENDGNEVRINTRRTYGEFIEYSKRCRISSWQIYKEPKPLLADTGIGDIVKTNLGDWLQIVDTPCLRFGHDECYRTHDGLYWDEYGVCDVDSTYNRLVAVEPLAPEGTAEWAWQMLKLQKPVSHPAEGELQDTDYTKEGFVHCMAKTGWQLYEPKPQPDKEDMHLRSGKDNPERQDFCHMYEPQPEPEYKVGDWVDCKDLAGVHAQCKVLEIHEHNVILGCKSGARWSLHHNNIIRKLSPSEVVIR